MTKEEYIESLKDNECIKRLNNFEYLNKKIVDDFTLVIEKNNKKYKCILKEKFPHFEKIKDFFKDNEITHILLDEDDCFYYFNWFDENIWKELTKKIDVLKFKLKLKNIDIYFDDDITLDNILKNKETGEMRFIDFKIIGI
jgi:hypothetical protein